MYFKSHISENTLLSMFLRVFASHIKTFHATSSPQMFGPTSFRGNSAAHVGVRVVLMDGGPSSR